MIFAIVGIVSLVVGVAVFMLLSQFDNKAVAREGLDLLDDYGSSSEIGVVDHRAQVLGASIFRRVLPSTEGLTQIGRKFTPADYVERSRFKIVATGDYSPNALDRFLAVRAISAIAAPIVFVVLLLALPLDGLLKFMAAALFGIAVFMLPDIRLNRAVEEREKRIIRDLPSVLDLLTISVEAGLGFDQAVDRVIANVPGPLTQEFHRMLGETRAGASRADSLRAMESRVNLPEVRSFLLAIIQADTFGVSIGRVLRAQAEEARIKRRQSAQERAMKAPVKMLIPIVLCIFPALFVVVLFPAVINIMENLG